MYKTVSVTLRRPWVRGGLRICLLTALSVVLFLRWKDLGPIDFLPRMNVGLLVVAALLMPVNLSAEAFKWRALSGGRALGFGRSLAGVLNGMCTGFLTPNRVGEVVGRWRIAPRRFKHRAMAGSVVGSVLQGGVTVGFGVFGILAYPYSEVIAFDRIVEFLRNPGAKVALTCMVVLVFVGVAVIAIRRMPIISAWWGKFTTALTRISAQGAVAGLCWAILRYAVFSLQFALALYAFGMVGDPVEVFAGIAAVYLVQSYFPGAILGEAGVREIVSIVVLAPFFANPLHALPAVLFIWIVNVVLPIAYTAGRRPKWIRDFGSD